MTEAELGDESRSQRFEERENFNAICSYLATYTTYTKREKYKERNLF